MMGISLPLGLVKIDHIPSIDVEDPEGVQGTLSIHCGRGDINGISANHNLGCSLPIGYYLCRSGYVSDNEC